MFSSEVLTFLALQTDSFRQCTMSVGSYQQYQQMQQNRAKKHLQFSGFLPSGNVTSRYFPSAVPPTSINSLSSGSLFVPTQPIEPSASLPPLQANISEALASGFFAREATTEPSVGKKLFSIFIIEQR